MVPLVAVAALVEFVLALMVLYGPFPSATDILIDLGDFRSWKIIALIVMYLVSSVLFILSAFKLRRVFSSLAQRSGKGIFNTAGIAYLIGAVLIGAYIASGGVRLSIGGLIISIAWILAAVAFLSAKFQPRAPAPPPSA